MENLHDWSEILPDILIDIVRCLPLMEDFTAFRGVCTNWRAAGAIKTQLFKNLSKVPLLMLSEREDGSDEREFYSLAKNNIFLRMPVVEAKGKRCIDAGFGWILALSPGGAVSLFNPFSSSSKIELPNFQTFPTHDEDLCDPDFIFVRRVMLSANPSVTSDFATFVGVNGSLGIWRNGDSNWTKLNENPNQFGNMRYYKGKFYAASEFGEILTWDPCGTDGKIRIIMQWESPMVLYICVLPYLVESSDGELLLIVRDDDIDTNFRVKRVDLVKMECKEINGLGKDAVFVGDNASVSVAADDFPEVIKPNCIYFTDDSLFPYFCDEFPKGGGKNMGIYNVGDGSIERFGVESFSKVCPPLWIFPSF